MPSRASTLIALNPSSVLGILTHGIGNPLCDVPAFGNHPLAPSVLTTSTEIGPSMMSAISCTAAR